MQQLLLLPGVYERRGAHMLLLLHNAPTLPLYILHADKDQATICDCTVEKHLALLSGVVPGGCLLLVNVSSFISFTLIEEHNY